MSTWRLEAVFVFHMNYMCFSEWSVASSNCNYCSLWTSECIQLGISFSMSINLLIVLQLFFFHLRMNLKDLWCFTLILKSLSYFISVTILTCTEHYPLHCIGVVKIYRVQLKWLLSLLPESDFKNDQWSFSPANGHLSALYLLALNNWPTSTNSV